MLHNEIKTPYLLGGIGLCLVMAVVFAYFFAPHFTRTKAIEDDAIVINAGPEPSSSDGTKINLPSFERKPASDEATTPEQPIHKTPPNLNNCADVRTAAKNPATQEIRDFPTPCDVPEGWETIPR